MIQNYLKYSDFTIFSVPEFSSTNYKQPVSHQA